MLDEIIGRGRLEPIQPTGELFDVDCNIRFSSTVQVTHEGFRPTVLRRCDRCVVRRVDSQPIPDGYYALQQLCGPIEFKTAAEVEQELQAERPSYAVASANNCNLAGCGKKCVQRAISPLVASFVSPERIFTGMCRVVGAPSVRFSTVRRHYDPDSLLGNRSGHQVSHAYQVVGRAGEGKHPIHFQRSAMPHLAQ